VGQAQDSLAGQRNLTDQSDNPDREPQDMTVTETLVHSQPAAAAVAQKT
jgi:hypothetical protein